MIKDKPAKSEVDLSPFIFKHDNLTMLMIKEYKIFGRLITFHLGLNMMIYTMIIEYRPTKP